MVSRGAAWRLPCFGEGVHPTYRNRMKFWTGVTDNRWFNFLSGLPSVEEVNFWHPSGRAPFNTLPEGTPFLFKLKSPYHHIAGGGFFIKFELLPLAVAWEAFGEKNGAASYQEFESLILSARGNRNEPSGDVGCSILGEPFFFAREDWIPLATEFSGNIVSGKSFESTAADGQRIWDTVQRQLHTNVLSPGRVAERPATYGAPILMRPRRGQGTFRALVTNAYQRRCAITGEGTLPVLEAAHIKPFGSDGFNNTFNGLLLRADFHKLFDAGLITVTPDHRVVVSNRIKEQWFNGKAYNRLNGELLASLPSNPADRPRADLLLWHNENRFEQGIIGA